MRTSCRSLRRVALAMGGALAACAPPVAPDAPDVVLITVDTLRADHLGAYGFPLDTSPAIDRLAAASVLFERAVAGSSATAPSHASIFVSRFTREHSIGWRNGDTRLEGPDALAMYFRDAGYATAAFVGNVALRSGLGFERGFDVYDDELPKPEVNREKVFERIAEQTAARALAWIAARGEEPLFLWVHFQDPHGPYAPPSAWRGRFRVPAAPDEEPLPLLDDNSGQGGVPRYQRLGEIRLPSVYRSRYADEIHYADRSIGALLEALAGRTAARESVVLLTADHGESPVLLTADHGESLGEAGQYFVHTMTTPDVAHVPLLLRAPGLAPGRRPGLVHHVDVLPTLLELAGLAVPPDARGIALGPLLRAGEAIPDRVLFTDIGHELCAYTRDGFVRARGVGGAWERDATLAPTWWRYVWEADGGWRRVEGAARPGEAVRRYAGEAVPMRRVTSLRGEVRSRLRALGYLDGE